MAAFPAPSKLTTPRNALGSGLLLSWNPYEPFTEPVYAALATPLNTDPARSQPQFVATNWRPWPPSVITMSSERVVPVSRAIVMLPGFKPTPFGMLEYVPVKVPVD